MKSADQLVRERIQQLCQSKDYTFYKLAKKSGFGHSTLIDFMNEKNTNIGILTIKKICNGLEISLYDFFDSVSFKDLE